MEDKLLYEITRFKQLSGLSLINEGIDDLFKLMGKRIKNVDDIINALELSGKELTDTDIDKFCNELKGTGAMLDSELNLLRKELKVNVKLRSALSKQSEDFVLAIKTSKNIKKLVGLVGVNVLNKAQMMVILVKVARELLDLTNSITRQSFDNIDNGFVNPLNKIFDNGFDLHNIDEIWDIIDGFILEKVNASGLSPDLAEAQFKEFSKRIRENSKTKDLIDKFNSSGRNAGKPKRTTSVTKYSTDYKLPDGLLGAKTWINVGDPVNVNSVIKRRRKVGLGDETLEKEYVDRYNDIIKKNGVDLTEEEKLFKETVEEWKVGKIDDVGEAFKTKVGEPKVGSGDGNIESMTANWEKRTPGKLARFNDVLIDILTPIYNLIRSVGGLVPSKVYLGQVERDLNELVTRFKENLSGVKISAENKDGFRNQVRQLLIDLQVAKKSNQTFEQLWDEIEVMIRSKSKELGFDDVDDFIKLVKQGGNEGGAGTIENFLKITSDYANGITIWPWVKKQKLYKDFNSRRLGEYTGILRKWKELSESFKSKVINTGEGKKGIGYVITAIRDISSFLWEWFSGWLVYQAPKKIQAINNALRVSGITNGAAIKRIIGLYLGMVFISYFYEPLIGATIELNSRVKAQFGVETEETRGYPTLIADQYKNKFNDLLRGKVDWNPFGVGVIPAVIVSLLDNPKEVADNQQEKLKKEISDAQSKVNSEMDKRALNTYNKMSDQEKQLAQNSYNTLKQMLSYSYGTYGLTKDQGKFIISRLEFTPTPSLNITNPINSGFNDMMKITDIKSLEALSSKYQDAKSVYAELPKVDKTDVVGNTFLKGKTNKYLVMIINEENQEEFPLDGKPIGYSYWIKPPYGKLSSGVKTTHYFKEFIEQFNNL